MIISWMCGVTLKHRCKSEELRKRLEIEDVSDVVRKSGLGWFRHLERKDAGDWVSACRNMARPIVGNAGKGRSKKRWNEVVKDDLKNAVWIEVQRKTGRDGRLKLWGKRSTCASTEKGT